MGALGASELLLASYLAFVCGTVGLIVSQRVGPLVPLPSENRGLELAVYSAGAFCLMVVFVWPLGWWRQRRAAARTAAAARASVLQLHAVIVDNARAVEIPLRSGTRVLAAVVELEVQLSARVALGALTVARSLTLRLASPEGALFAQFDSHPSALVQPALEDAALDVRLDEVPAGSVVIAGVARFVLPPDRAAAGPLPFALLSLSFVNAVTGESATVERTFRAELGPVTVAPPSSPVPPHARAAS